MNRRKIRVFLGQDDQFYFAIVGDNGEIVAQSEGYEEVTSAMDTITKYFDDYDVVRRFDDGREEILLFAEVDDDA